MSHRIEYGTFCVWSYNGPSKRARGFWHGDSPIDRPMWAYALRSPDGKFWETSKAKGGFTDEASAHAAATAAVVDRARGAA